MEPHASSTAPRSPRLPAALSLPLRLLPGSVHSRLLAALLRRILGRAFEEGALDFLADRVVALRIVDAGVEIRLTQRDGQLVAYAGRRNADAAISGALHDFLLLSGGREDPDTLFFQRRLRLEGDVDLGLEVKNLLYGLDGDAIAAPLPLRRAFAQATTLYERLFS